MIAPMRDISSRDGCGVAPGLRTKWSWVQTPAGAGNFSLHHRVHTGSPVLGPTQPSIQWVPATLSLELKRPGREADHSPPSSAEVKNA
jgi:hypothetical protein